MKEILIIAGMKHCGKTTIGRFLAQERSCPFYDLDELILELNSHNYNSIRELFRQEGQNFFQEKEREAAQLLLQTQKNQHCVLSLGGGSIENRELIEDLKTKGIFLYLRADMEFIFKRIIRKGIPPFLSSENPKKSFHDLYQKRTPLYEQDADIIIDVFDNPREENQKNVLSILRSRYGW